MEKCDRGGSMHTFIYIQNVLSLLRSQFRIRTYYYQYGRFSFCTFVPLSLAVLFGVRASSRTCFFPLSCGFEALFSGLGSVAGFRGRAPRFSPPTRWLSRCTSALDMSYWFIFIYIHRIIFIFWCSVFGVCFFVRATSVFSKGSPFADGRENEHICLNLKEDVAFDII